MKKIIQWYQLLSDQNLLDISEEEQSEEKSPEE
jgi:hypothetical protein